MHDECSADVKDLKVIDRILKPHRDGLPAVVLHCGMHCYRSKGWPKEYAVVRVHRIADHRSRPPIADRRHLHRPREPDHRTALRIGRRSRKSFITTAPGNLLDTGTCLGPRQAGTADDYVTVVDQHLRGKARVFGTTLGHNNDGRRRPLSRSRHPRPAMVARQTRRPHLKPAKKVLIEE